MREGERERERERENREERGVGADVFFCFSPPSSSSFFLFSRISLRSSSFPFQLLLSDLFSREHTQNT